jgi:DNA-binding MarR family transcriptional regulator
VTERTSQTRASQTRQRSGPPTTPEQLRSYVPYLINRLSNRWNLDQNRDLSAHGINNVVLRTLSVLNIYKTLTVNEIAILAVTEQSTASRTIDAMVSAGWVKREIGEKDLRRREIALTKAGEALLKKVYPVIDRNYEALARGIDRSEVEICARVLARMIDNVRQNDI